MSCSTWKCVYYIYCVVLILVWGLGQHLKGKKKLSREAKVPRKKESNQIKMVISFHY